MNINININYVNINVVVIIVILIIYIHCIIYNIVIYICRMRFHLRILVRY